MKDIVFVTTTLYTKWLDYQSKIIKDLFPDSEHIIVDDNFEPYYAFLWKMKEMGLNFDYLYPNFDERFKSTNPRIDKYSTDIGIHMWYTRNWNSEIIVSGVKNISRYMELEKFLKNGDKLYIFITHQGNINNCYDRINNMMSKLGLDFIIVQGGFIKDSYNEEKKILNLNCDDRYVGLPEKVMKTFHFLISDDRFRNYKHFVKLDDDMKVIKPFDIDGDYIGNVHYGDGNRGWHMGRTGTFWDKIPYMGDFKPWCMGGYGYIVSRESLVKIVPDYDYLNHIYEDVYIGLLMNKVGVEPKKINTKEYLVSPDH